DSGSGDDREPLLLVRIAVDPARCERVLGLLDGFERVHIPTPQQPRAVQPWPALYAQRPSEPGGMTAAWRASKPSRRSQMESSSSASGMIAATALLLLVVLVVILMSNGAFSPDGGGIDIRLGR